ncbi:uncharacterized protein LOC130591129 [Beta vulgaris subsp. vulgaris]|uniref:uncharacterized protein LOC130591129 n=1 Tax=Beta vulgaris subsp. vulgaris TaxID=3555 RepID=UPI002548734A|nr:uncharacterized protein LOC130591129 [Beta vulgaris subsp. vulgaris]
MPENTIQQKCWTENYTSIIICWESRDMHQTYQDADGFGAHICKPDIFLTMTCNPSWSEIVAELLPGQQPHDRPDLLTRVFHARLEELKKDVLERNVLGKVVAYVYVIEFQKRGLPHVHMLLILDQSDKLATPDDYDKIVRAEIPDQQQEPELHKRILKHMIHNPCGVQNPRSPCMKQGSCKKGFLSHSLIVQSKEMTHIPSTVGVKMLHLDMHSIKCVKYLYKYIHKGSDRVSMEVHKGDEIAQFVDARWICAPEAMWKFYKFPMTRMNPSVDRLQVHLPNMHQVRFEGNQPIESILADPRNSKTMLTEFFKMNSVDPEARNYLYREFPEKYRWINSTREWRRRKTMQRVIGRLYSTRE